MTTDKQQELSMILDEIYINRALEIISRLTWWNGNTLSVYDTNTQELNGMPTDTTKFIFLNNFIKHKSIEFYYALEKNNFNIHDIYLIKTNNYILSADCVFRLIQKIIFALNAENFEDKVIDEIIEQLKEYMD